MAYIKQKKYPTPKALFAYSSGNECTRNATLTGDFIQPDADGDKVVPQGMFLSLVGTDYRYLPRTTTTAAITASSTTSFTATPVFQLKANDVLYVVEPFAAITISAIASSQTLTVTVAGRSRVVTSATATAATFAIAVAADLNTAPYLKDLVYACAAGAKVYLFAKDGRTEYTLAIATTGTAAIDGSVTKLTVNNTAVGTVLSVNVATSTVTLTAAAGVTLPIGAHIGVLVNEIIGIDECQRDFTDQVRQNVGVYTESQGVRQQFVPYLDGDVQSALPGLVFGTKF